MQRTALVVVFACFVGAAAAEGCGSDSKGDDSTGLPERQPVSEAGGDGSGGGTDDKDTGASASCTNLTLKVSDTPACDTCAKDKCCDAVLACDKSADCKALQDCLAPCANDDLTCILTCQTVHESGANVLQELGACVQASCKTECPDNTPDGDLFGDAF